MCVCACVKYGGHTPWTSYPRWNLIANDSFGGLQSVSQASKEDIRGDVVNSLETLRRGAATRR